MNLMNKVMGSFGKMGGDMPGGFGAGADSSGPTVEEEPPSGETGDVEEID